MNRNTNRCVWRRCWNCADCRDIGAIALLLVLGAALSCVINSDAAYSALVGVFAVIIGAMAHGMANRSEARRRWRTEQLDRIGGLHQELRRLCQQFSHIRTLLANDGEVRLQLAQRLAAINAYDCSTTAWERHGDAVGSTSIYNAISDAFQNALEIKHMIKVIQMDFPGETFEELNAQVFAENVGQRLDPMTVSVDRIGAWIEAERQKL